MLRRMKGAILATLALSAVAARADAQVADSSDPLAPPVGDIMMCRVLPPDSTTAGAIHFEWWLRFGRTINLWYDSSGSPLRLEVLAPEPPPGTPKTVGLVARLGPGAPSGAIGAIDRGFAENPAPASDGVRPMTPAELERAAALATWLWQRRCGGRAAPAPRPPPPS